MRSKLSLIIPFPSGSDLWSDPKQTRRLCNHGLDETQTIFQTILRVRWPLVRLSPDQNATDQTIFWTSSDHLQTIVHTIVRPRPTPNPDHRPDNCSRQITSDQTIPKQKCHYSDQFLVETWSGQGASLMWTNWYSILTIEFRDVRRIHIFYLIYHIKIRLLLFF